jgi:hypothetical protein
MNICHMNSTLTSDTPPRELCSRSSDRIEVALLWTPGTEQLCVAVVDLRSNQSFVRPVEARHAMRVFNHPYPYAAERGLLEDDLGTAPTLPNPAVLKAEGLAP